MTWGGAAVLGAVAAVAVLLVALALVAVARLANPAPLVKNAFVGGQVFADQAAYRSTAKLGRIGPDCDIAGLLVTTDKKFSDYLFAPQIPRDPERVLGTCQMVRDIAYMDSSTGFDTRALAGNPLGLRGLSRLALALAPMSIWLVVQAIFAAAIGLGAIFLLKRQGDLTLFKAGVLGVATLTAVAYSLTSLSLGFGALLWPVAVAAVFLIGTRLSWSQSPWRMTALSALAGAVAIMFDYSAGLACSLLLSLVFAQAALGSNWTTLGRNALAFVVAALLTVAVLAVANVSTRGLEPAAAAYYIVDRFTDASAFLRLDGVGALSRSAARLGKLLAAGSGAAGASFYAILCLIAFSAWAILLKGQKRLGTLVFVALAVGLGWALLVFDRVTSDPMQFASLPLLLLAYTLVAVVATFAGRRAGSLESAL